MRGRGGLKMGSDRWRLDGFEGGGGTIKGGGGGGVWYFRVIDR